MLSAVAARKARLKTESQNASEGTSVPNVEEPRVAERETRPVIKRKQKAHSSQRSPSKKQRVYDEKADEHTLSGVTRSVGVSLDVELNLEELEIDEAGEVGEKLDTESDEPIDPLSKRPYSPSMPVDDDEKLLAESSDIRNSKPVTDPHTPSTFQPSNGHNMFLLSISEIKALRLTGADALALVLSPTDTFGFIGLAKLSVLAGSISLFGTTLHPSKLCHDVFAPRTSPIPIITVVDSRQRTEVEVPELPLKIKNKIKPGDAVIVLQELDNGIEGLGRAVRTFDDFFAPRAVDIVERLPLSGIHMVCCNVRGS